MTPDRSSSPPSRGGTSTPLAARGGTPHGWCLEDTMEPVDRQSGGSPGSAFRRASGAFLKGPWPGKGCRSQCLPGTNLPCTPETLSERKGIGSSWGKGCGTCAPGRVHGLPPVRGKKPIRAPSPRPSRPCRATSNANTTGCNPSARCPSPGGSRRGAPMKNRLVCGAQLVCTLSLARVGAESPANPALRSATHGPGAGLFSLALAGIHAETPQEVGNAPAMEPAGP
jgi:hypothetical protein